MAQDTIGGGSSRKAFGKQSPFRAEELPTGKLRANLQSLNPQAKDKAMKWLHTFDFSESDAAKLLRVDNDGGIFIVCPDDHGNCDGHSHGPATQNANQDESTASGSIVTESDQPADPPIAYAAVSANSPPVYHSRPGATKRIYLDFNGGIVSGTAWNSNGNSFNVKVWSQDADRTTFNDAEQAWMKKIWQRVAEDYAPFDVDVTTDTAYDPDNHTGNKDNVGWLMICETTDNNGIALPHAGSGGVAYVGVFGNSSYSPTYQPAWVSSTNGGGSESIVAEAASHEMGHNMGLSHDATPTSDYYGGHGTGDISWGPLMGTGYNRNVSQWSKGEYYNANLFQDDLSIISTRVPYRSDDHGNSPGTATPLTITNGTTISSSTPENDPSNSNPENKGLIERNTDVDVFSFYTGAGTVQLNANPWVQPSGTRGGNLDILLELHDAAGTLVTSNNAANLTSASINTTLTDGFYYLHVKNTGTGSPLTSPASGYTAYGSIGQYFISGTIVDADPPFILAGITPASGNSGSIVTASITGTGMSASTTFKLTKTGQADISATNVQLSGSTLRCEINLTGATSGTWNLVATNPNLETSTLPNAFTVIGTIWSENFEGTANGWASNSSNGSNSWTFTNAESHSPDTSYFAPAPASRTTTDLSSPPIAIPVSAINLQLAFWHYYDLESRRDGGKIEFSINGGAWFDADSSGSGVTFTSNGFNNSITASRNDFYGDQVWTGSSGGFVETIIDFTDNAKFAGTNLRIRWNLATDNRNRNTSNGWHVDSITLLGNVGTPNALPVVTLAASSSSGETETDPDTSVYQVVRTTGTDLSVAATDDEGEPALTYVWSATGGPVTFSQNGTNSAKNTRATFQTAGDYQISVSISDTASLTATSSVNVRVYQTPAGLAVTPASTSVQFGGTRQLSASLLDQFGNQVTGPPPSFDWSASGGGTCDSSGLFTATAAGGPFVISASNGPLSNTAAITVTPAPVSITLDGLARTFDGTPKPVTVATNPSGLAVSVTYEGSPVAPTATGTYTVIATIDDPNYEGSASGSLIIEPGNDLVSWKNENFTPAEQSAGLATNNADPDSDGLQNLAEFALGTDPRGFTPPLVPTLDENGLTLTFSRPANLPGVSYSAESAEEFGAWLPVPIETVTPGDPETVRARDPLTTGDPSRRFLRLRFETQ